MESQMRDSGTSLTKASAGDSPSRNDRTSDGLRAVIRHLLVLVGENPERRGLLDTPRRVEETLRFLTDGYGVEPADVIGNAIFPVTTSGLVLVRDIEFYSQCEHHLLPFFGHVHIAYIPCGKVVGLSKLPRLVDVFAHRLQMQEQLTEQIADALTDTLSPLGVGVVVSASHLCMMMRGVEKQCSSTFTSAFRGVMTTDMTRRGEFMNLVGRAHRIS